MREKLPAIQSETLEDIEAQENKTSLYRIYWRMLLRKSWLIVILTALTTIAGAIWSSLDPSSYTGNFYLLVEPITSASKLTNPTTIARTDGNPRTDLFSLDYPTNLAFLQSPGMTYRIAQDIQEQGKTDKSLPEVWSELREGLSVDRIQVGSTSRQDTKIFSVTYSGENPEEVQSILEIAADTFMAYSADDRQTSIEAGVNFIDQQIPTLEKRLDQLKSRLQGMQQKYNLLDPTVKGQEILKQATDYTQQITNLQIQLNAKRTLYNLLNQQLQLSPQEALAASALSQDPTRTSLMGQLQTAENELASVTATFTANSPQVQDLKERRDNLKKLLQDKTQRILGQNAVNPLPNSSVLAYQDSTRMSLIGQLLQTANEVEVLEEQQRGLKAAQSQAKQSAKIYPAIINQYSELQRQAQLTQQILDNLLVQRETLKVESSQDLPWQLISKPQVPQDAEGLPIGEPPSRVRKIGMGMVGGLLAGLLLALLLEKRRNIFYQVEDIPDILDLPLIGEIPYCERLNQLEGLPVDDEAPKEELSEESPLVALDGLSDPDFADAFEMIQTDLSLLYSDPPLRSIIISSSDPGDGQTTVALNLAIAATNAGQRVLLVDTNWDHPQLHQWLNLSNHKGLANLLTDGTKPEEMIQAIATLDRIDFLSAGTQAPQRRPRLGSTEMESLIKELEKQYDLVIYDAPHLTDSGDLGLMAVNCDGILLVAAVKKTAQSWAKRMVKKFKGLNVPFLGVIANRPNPS